MNNVIFRQTMKRCSAFNEGFSFDPNDVSIPVKSKKKKKAKEVEKESDEELKSSLSTIDLLIQNVTKEKKDFYSRVLQHTKEQA